MPYGTPVPLSCVLITTQSIRPITGCAEALVMCQQRLHLSKGNGKIYPSPVQNTRQPIAKNLSHITVLAISISVPNLAQIRPLGLLYKGVITKIIYIYRSVAQYCLYCSKGD